MILSQSFDHWRRLLGFFTSRNPGYGLHPVPAQEYLSEEQQMSDPPVQLSVADQIWLKKFDAFLLKSLHLSYLSVPEIAEFFSMSESSLLRKVKRLTGISPSKYLQNMRMDHARRFLKNGHYASIKEVADAVGYRNRNSFTRSFKQYCGKLPSDFLLKSHGRHYPGSLSK
ncbi:MAG: helix-turn-helix transcriptional regulator [Bacteroidota bacterium]